MGDQKRAASDARVGRGSLVGREQELRLIDEAVASLGRAEVRRARVLEITGEPGVGKSRLLAALRARSDAQAQVVLAGRAAEDELPFGVFVDALDDHLATSPPVLLSADDTARCAQVFPALQDAEAGQAAPRLAGRYLIHRAIRQLLEHLARPAPLTLVLDDLHWADAASVELLDHLLRHPPRGPILLALAYRPRQAGVPLTAALTRAAADGRLRSIGLGPLDLEQSAQLLGSGVEPDLHQKLHLASGGNPFYLEALAHSGAAPAPRPPDDEAGDVPPMVESALLAEVSRLSAEARLVAHAAAVVGDPFDIELVAECAEIPVVEVLGCIDELRDRDLVRPTDTPRRFQFRHSLVRHVVYRSTGQVFRVTAHARTAKAMEQRGAAASVRAHHVERSADMGDEAAIDVLVEAAHENLSTAPAATARWLDAAMRLLPHGPRTAHRHTELALARGRALAVAGDLVASRDILHGVLGGMPLEPSPERFRAIGLCAMVERLLGRASQARALVLRELERHRENDTPELTMLQLELTSADLFRGQATGAQERARSALHQARRHADRALEARACGLLAASGVTAGAVEPALEWLDTATTLVDGLYDAELRDHLDALYWVGWSCAFLDRYEECLRHADRTIRLVQATGQDYSFAFCHGARSTALQWLGRLDEAALAADSAVEAALLSSSEEMCCFALGQRAWTAFLRGELETAIEAGDQALRSAYAIEGGSRAIRAYRHAIVRLAAGLDDGADGLLRAGGGPEAPGLDDFNKVIYYEYLTAAEIAVGRIDDAAQWAARAEALGHPQLPTRVGFGLLAAARVTLAEGAARAAADLATRAAEAFARALDRYDAGRGHLLAGQAWRQAGDPERAKVQLGRAADVFAACGARLAHEEAVRELRRAGARTARLSLPSQPGVDANRLTPRESEIAAMVAQGRSNREIAATLFLSARTVETHVSHILAKLGVNTRVAIAAVVLGR